MNYPGAKRVRSIPNILRRSGGSNEKSNVKIESTVKEMENLSNSRYNGGSDVASIAVNDKTAAKQFAEKTLKRNERRRKQVLRFRDMSQEDCEWEICPSETLPETESDEEDSETSVSFFLDAATDHQVPSTSQLSNDHSSLEFFFDEETKWLDVQSSVEVESQEVIEVIPELPLVDKFEEAPVDAKGAKRIGKKKCKATVTHSSEIENRDPRTNDKSELTVQWHCWICDKRYTYKCSLRSHLKKVHDLNDRTLETPESLTSGLCSKKFRSVGPYEKHLKSHVK